MLVAAQTLDGQGAVAAHQVGQHLRGKLGLLGGAGGHRGVAGLAQQVGHGMCPPLLVGLEVVHVPQVTQQMRTAPGVQCLGQVRTAAVAVPDDDALVAGQHPARVDAVGRAVAGVQQGQVPGAGHMDPGQPARVAGRGLIHVERRGTAQQVTDVRAEAIQPPGGLAAHPGHPCRRCAASTATAVRSAPQPAHTPGRQETRTCGASTSRIVAPGAPGCLPARRCPAPAATGRNAWAAW
jgi:hypothetical protein